MDTLPLHRRQLFIVIVCLLLMLRGSTSTWWSLSQLPIQSLSLVQSGAICDNIPDLNSRQRRLCRSKPGLMVSVVDGSKISVDECQHQFRANRWNCSASERDPSVFGKILLKGSREAAFVYSILSAGVVHAITRACSRGDLLDCACDPSKIGKGRDKRGSFEWGGCSDNVLNGSRFARKFVDARETVRHDARARMNLHNNRAGRRAVRKSRKLECKCHGVSGSCALRTCWLAMQDFRQVGRVLRDRYNGATQVMMDQSGTGLVVADRNHKRPTRSDLVYLEASPDYCIQDPKKGSLGTAGRECNKDSQGPDGCDILCCGRGYDTQTVRRVLKCGCKFIWCCDVKCERCEELVDVHTCKGPNPTAPPPPDRSYLNAQ